MSLVKDGNKVLNVYIKSITNMGNLLSISEKHNMTYFVHCQNNRTILSTLRRSVVFVLLKCSNGYDICFRVALWGIFFGVNHHRFAKDY